MSKYLIPVFTAAVGVAVLVSLFVSPPGQERRSESLEPLVYRLPSPTAEPPRSARSADPAPVGERPAAQNAQGPARTDAAASPVSAGTARTLGLDDAMRELALIRPSREKLAQDFSLTTADGKTFRLAEHRGKIVFINFWATWCPPCKEEMPAMDRLYRKHRDRGFVMVAVSVDTDPAVVQPFLDEHRFAFAVALDPKMDVANAYAVRALPSSFIVDARGTMTALALGPRVWDGTAAHALIERLAR